MKVPIQIKPSDVEEITTKEHPKDIVEELAELKGRDIFSQEFPKDNQVFVVASDTLVAIGDKVLGKPNDREHARQMLLELSGKEHDVFTAVYMACGDKEYTFSRCSKVKFTDISPEILDLYLESDEALDKAGSYGIQGQGLLFVEHMSGSYSNVVGFPLADFIAEMKTFLNEMGLDSKNWRQLFQ
ncbi:Maf family protein [Halobacteriovorax sp. HFRX-2_2]|uniref:Maf family protein n=1 Tax=unclassified Halobacteriovorax TaxID=2639665 RepID=UPI00372228FE